MKWYYAKQGRATGPVSQDELQKMTREGVLKPDSLIWHPGLDGWDTVDTLLPAGASSKSPSADPSAPPVRAGKETAPVVDATPGPVSAGKESGTSSSQTAPVAVVAAVADTSPVTPLTPASTTPTPGSKQTQPAPAATGEKLPPNTKKDFPTGGIKRTPLPTAPKKTAPVEPGKISETPVSIVGDEKKYPVPDAAKKADETAPKPAAATVETKPEEKPTTPQPTAPVKGGPPAPNVPKPGLKPINAGKPSAPSAPGPIKSGPPQAKPAEPKKTDEAPAEKRGFLGRLFGKK